MASPPNFPLLDEELFASLRKMVNHRTYPKKDNRTIIVYNLKPTTSKGAIKKVFEKFGPHPKVILKMDKQGQPDGSAHVEFDRRPSGLDITQPLFIGDQAVRMEHGRIISEQQRPTFCKAASLTLGMMLTETEFVEEWSVHERVIVAVHYEKGRMNVEFRLARVCYRMEIKFGDIDNNVVVENIDSATYLTLRLIQPPKVEQFNSVIPKRLTTIPFTVAAAATTTTTTSHDASNETCDTPTQIHATANNVRLETWNVFRMKFDIQQKEDKKWVRSMLAGMADYNLVPRDALLNTHKLLTITSPTNLPVPKTHQERAHLLAFDVLYHLECNISANYLMERNLDDLFYHRLSSYDPLTACGILTLMCEHKTRVWQPVERMETIFKDHGTTSLRKIGKPQLRKLLITPTTIQFKLLPTGNDSRVLRHFKQYADRFLRVQFTDEDMMRLGPDFGSSCLNNELYDRVYQTLMNGIQVGTRRYDYLGHSSSQLREHGCWFYAATDKGPDLPPLDADMIRAWMGKFKDIKIVAKYAARMGQSFSSIRVTMPLTKEQVTNTEDIVAGKYTFSDGAGNISHDLAKKLMWKLSLTVVPSAFQFRLGGAKGVLVVSDKLKKGKVQLRPSQIKFESDHVALEILDTSSFTPVFLNRQAITLLSTLGIKDEIFMTKLNAVLRGLNTMWRRPETAVKILKGYPDRFGMVTFMTKIIQADFLKRRDPFIRNLLNIVRLRTLKNLKEKAKLSVQKGAFVFGVLDESGDLDEEGVLKEGEIFCQVTNSLEQKKPFVVEGQCIVYRNPCFHPGDIRVVTAVDRSDILGHLNNVVVFPRAGERDIPSMCSGGDLDGDKYTIIWDKELVEGIVNHPPMDYTPSDIRTETNVTIDDIKAFYVDYIKSDNLGQIANAHLAAADDSELGARDAKCLKLAELHSLAVDFAKTGSAAIMDRDLMIHRYPDFMCKTDKPSYVSEKVLGKMFRRTNKLDDDEYELKVLKNSIYDTRLWVSGMDRHIPKARRSLNKYNKELRALMKKYGVKTEAEIISGFVVTWINGCNKRTEYDSQIQTASAVKKLRENWEKEFYREFVKQDKPNTTKSPKGKNKINNSSNNKASSYSMEMKSDMDAKAAAWYYVTYHPEERNLRHVINEEPYFSFAWMVVDILIDLAQRPNNQERNGEMMEAVDENLIREDQPHTASDDIQGANISHGGNSSIDDDSNDSTYEGSDSSSPNNKEAKDILDPISDLAVGELMATGDSDGPPIGN